MSEASKSFIAISKKRIITFVHGNNYKHLDLVTRTADDAKLWVTGISYLLSEQFKKEGCVKKHRRNSFRDKWLDEMFRDVKEEIEEDEVIKAVKKINNTLSNKQIISLIKQIRRESGKGENNQLKLNAREFRILFKKISTRPDVHLIFLRYAKNMEAMNCEELKFFLEYEQGCEDISQEKCVEIIKNFEPSVNTRKNNLLSIDGFTAYIFSEECFLSKRPSVDHVMDEPLSNYFIASSHNTFLTRDQASGVCGVEGYIKALDKNCRCIKITVRDGPNSEPVVEKDPCLLLEQVLETINKYAFKKSEFPLIINLDVFCSLNQQIKAVQMIKSIFGEKLLMPVKSLLSQNLSKKFNFFGVSYYTFDPDKNILPSPNSLKHKIIIMGRQLQAREKYVLIADEEETLEYARNRDEDLLPQTFPLTKSVSDLTTLNKVSYKKSCLSLTAFDARVARENEIFTMQSAFEQQDNSNTTKNIILVLPDSSRFDSSNVDAHIFWQFGCQLVAMNYQTIGRAIDIYEGFFQMNGACGYVLKPNFLTNTENSKQLINKHTSFCTNIRIKIISAHNIPKPLRADSRVTTLDPYVSLEVIGVQKDCSIKKTRTINHCEPCSILDPHFDELFEFEVTEPQLAVVRFALLDDEYIGDEFIGQYSIPVSCMEVGYRQVPLKNCEGKTIDNSSLFVQVSIDKSKKINKEERRKNSFFKVSSSNQILQLKFLGNKQIDENLKIATGILREAYELNKKSNIALTVLKNLCGLTPSSTTNQTIRKLFSRFKNLQNEVQFNVGEKDEMPVLKVTGDIPELMRKAIFAYENFVSCYKTLEVRSKDFIGKIKGVREILESYNEQLLINIPESASKIKKSNKLKENNDWNIRVLRVHEGALQEAQEEAATALKQVLSASTFWVTNESINQ